jgi:hypothetical protein
VRDVQIGRGRTNINKLMSPPTGAFAEFGDRPDKLNWCD